MASEYRDEVERIIVGAPTGALKMAFVELIALGVRLGLEAAAAAVEDTEDDSECRRYGRGFAQIILSLSPTDILKAKAPKP